MFFAYFLFRTTIFNFNYIGKYCGLEDVGTIEGIAGNGELNFLLKLLKYRQIFIKYESLNTLNLQIYQSIYPLLICILSAVALMVTPSQFCMTFSVFSSVFQYAKLNSNRNVLSSHGQRDILPL